MSDIAVLLRKHLRERVADMTLVLAGGNCTHEQYLKLCGEIAGMKYAIEELDALLKKHPGGVSDLEEFDDDMNVK